MSYKSCVEEAIRLAELAEKNFGLKPTRVIGYDKEIGILSCFATTKIKTGLYIADITWRIGIVKAWRTWPSITEPTLTLEEALKEAIELEKNQ